MSTPLEITAGLLAQAHSIGGKTVAGFISALYYAKLYGRDTSILTNQQNALITEFNIAQLGYYQNQLNTILQSANDQLDASGYASNVQSKVDNIQDVINHLMSIGTISALWLNVGSGIGTNTNPLPSAVVANSYVSLGFIEGAEGQLTDYPAASTYVKDTYDALTMASSFSAQYAALCAAEFATATINAINANNSANATTSATSTTSAKNVAVSAYAATQQNNTNALNYGSNGSFTYIFNANFESVTLSSLISSAETASTSASASNTTAQNALSAYLAPAPSPAPAPAPSPSPSPAPAPSPSPAPAPAPSPSSADPHAHNSISVNFNVLIDANSNLTVLGEQFVTPTNIVTATYNMPVTALYDPDNKIGLIEMWEPADVPGDIKVTFAGISDTGVGNNINPGVYETAIRRLAVEFQKVLVNSLDCSQAIPYNDAKYAGVSEYTLQRDFGRLALGTFAHYMFGHVDATVAITNDVAFVKNMLSIDAGEVDETSGGPAARYNAWRFKDYVNDTSAPLYDWQGAIDYVDPSDANLAQRLAHSIYLKGADGVPSLVSTASTSSLAYIVKQVIGQDAQRTKMVDGSERTRDYHQLLRFYAGDIIYVNIKLKKPSVTVGGGQAGVSATSLGDAYDTEDEQNYTIKIELA
jgi:hypothetical protein